MEIRIEQIQFNNYRQYGTGVLLLNATGEYSLTALVARNGTGKTTLLNAITWCLYEKEFQLSAAEDALPEINSALITKEHEGEVIDVSVVLIVVDNKKTVEFKRSKPFKINGYGDNFSCVPGTAKFTAAVTEGEGLENTGVFIDEEADVLAKKYFDIAIHNFYFFDGEKLGEFFNVGRTKDIKTSIFNISQVTLLEKAKNHAESMRYNLSRKMSKDSPELDALLQERQQLSDRIQLNESVRDGCLEQISKQEDLIRKCDKSLKEYRPVQKLQEERIEKETILDELDKQEAKLISNRSVFIRRNIMLLNLYPHMKRVLEIIAQKEDEGELPPSIDPVLIKRVLELHEKTCPFCNGEITENSVQHLNQLLHQFSVTSAASNNLKEIKSSLEEFVEEAKGYKVKKEEFTDLLADIDSKKYKIKQRLEEISNLLSNFNESGADIVSSLEAKRKEAIESCNAENQSLGAAKEQISQSQRRLNIVEDEIRKIEDKKKEFSSIQAQIKVLDMLSSGFEKIKDNIMNVMKAEISSTTWDIFKSMIWKQNTFGEIKIDDDYIVSVYDKDGRRMTGSLGATEQMALAYAFTLAIHEASGKNCPLVIDSPLGRSSDDNRDNIAKALLEISKEKQIVLLFTPAEYSESVQNIYNGKANVEFLSLTEDEKHIKEVMVNGQGIKLT